MATKNLQIIFKVDPLQARGFRSVCVSKGLSMADVFRQIVKKVSAGDTTLLEKIVK